MGDRVDRAARVSAGAQGRSLRRCGCPQKRQWAAYMTAAPSHQASASITGMPPPSGPGARLQEVINQHDGEEDPEDLSDGHVTAGVPVPVPVLVPLLSPSHWLTRCAIAPATAAIAGP